MESGSWAVSLVLGLAALVAAWLYRPNALFALGCLVGGALIFLGWRASAGGNVRLAGTYSLLGVVAMVGALIVEIERPLHVLVACGFSIMGAVLFGLISFARRARSTPRT
jgi:hypothetical protein